jgi:hypothetical protein
MEQSQFQVSEKMIITYSLFESHKYCPLLLNPSILNSGRPDLHNLINKYVKALVKTYDQIFIELSFCSIILKYQLELKQLFKNCVVHGHITHEAMNCQKEFIVTHKYLKNNTFLRFSVRISAPLNIKIKKGYCYLLKYLTTWFTTHCGVQMKKEGGK